MSEQTNSICSDNIFAEHDEELLEARQRAFLADPQQAHAAGLDLINQGQITMALANLDLIDADGADRAELAVFETPLHDVLDRLVDLLPTGVEASGRLGPGQFTGPLRQKQHVGAGQGVLAHRTRDLLDLDAAGDALDAPHAVP